MTHFPRLRKLSTDALKANHDLVCRCLQADDLAGNDAKPYGLRQHPGWQKLADALEDELVMRDEMVETIDWTGR